ncbi:hypothetical protein ABPG73_008241 [Tetrahymena malaccensis]
MKNIWIYSTIILLELAKYTILKSSCGLGCKICQQSTCIQCYDNYSLDSQQGLCVYQECMQNFYFQPSQDYNQGQCQSICNPFYISNQQQNVCIEIEQCSFSYLSLQNIIDNQKLLDMIAYQDNYFAIFYDGYISVFQQQTFQLYQHIQFQIGDVRAFHLNNMVIVQAQDFSFQTWDLVNNSRFQLLNSTQFQMNSQSSLFEFSQSQNLGLILQQSANNQSIIGVIFDQNSGTIYQEFSININSKINFLTYKYNLIIIQTDLQIQFYDVKLITSSSQQLRVLNGDNQQILLQSQTGLVLFELVRNIQLGDEMQHVNDFEVFQNESNIVNVLVLFSNSTLGIYQYNIQKQQLIIAQTIQLIQQNLQRIIFLAQQQSNSNSQVAGIQKIALIGLSVQILDIDLNSYQSNSNVIANYQKNVPYASSQTVQIVILYSLMQLITCHINGDIIFYDISSGQYSELFLVINNPQSACVNMLSYLDQFIVVQLSDRILFFSGLDQSIVKQIGTTNYQNTFIQNNNNNLLIIQDQCITILDNNLSLLFNKCQQSFLNQLKSIIFLSNFDLYIQLNQQLVYYQFDTNQQQYEKANLSFDLGNSEILYFTYIKIYLNQVNKQQNYFDIDKFIIFSKNQEIYILTKQMQVVYIFKNINLSEVSSIIGTDSEDLYYVTGYNTQNPPIAVIYALFIGQSDPISLSCIPTSPFLGDTFIKANQNGNQQYYYENIVQLNYLTVYSQYVFNLNSKDSLYTRVQYIVGDNESVKQTFQRGSQLNSILYSGTFNGELMSKSNSITDYDILNIKQSFKDYTDLIVELKQSIYLGIYLIRTNHLVSIYDLYTNQFLEILTLNGQIKPFVYCDFIEKRYSVMCYNDQQIVLRQFFQQSQKFGFSTNFNINGYLYDNQTNTIYVYGQSILQLNSQLQQLSVVLTQQDGVTINSCQLSSNNLICVNSQNYLVLINKINFYQQKAIQIIGFQNNFNLLIDEQYQRLILFKEICLVFDFNGQIKNNLGQIVGEITQYGIHDQYYIIFSNYQGTIINRNSLAISQIVSPASISILKYVYVNLNQQIAYFCSASSFGQIYIYDINTDQTNKVSSTNGNQQTVVDMMYFLEQSSLLYLDQAGQLFYNFLFQPYQFVGGIVITEIVDQNQKLIGIFYDNQSSYLFVYTQTNVYLINVSNLGYKFQIQLNYKNIQFTEIMLQNEQNINSQFLVIGDQNIIYRYQEQYITSEIVFLQEQQLKDIMYDIGSDVLVIAFADKILLLQNYEQNYQNGKQSPQIQLDLKFQRFLATNIYQTLDKKVIHLDIQSGQIIKTIQIQIDQFINSFLYDQQNNILLIGLNDLSVLLYLVDTTKIQTYRFEQLSKIFTSVKFIGIISYQEYYFATLGGQFMIIDYQINKIVSQSNLNQQLNIEEDLFLLNIQYDNLYNRIVYNFIGDFKVYIWDLELQKLEQIIGIPNTHSNQISISSKFILTKSSSQINFYSRSRPCLFITSVQKYTITNQIMYYQIVADIYLILTFQQKFEVFVIDGQSNFMIDQQSFTYPILMKLNQIDQFIYLYGLHQDGAFIYSYNVNLYSYQVQNYQQGSIQTNNTAFQCYISTQSNNNYLAILNQIISNSPITQQVVGVNGRTVQNKIDTQTYVFLSIFGSQLLNLSDKISQLNEISNIIFLPANENQKNLTFSQSVQIQLEKQEITHLNQKYSGIISIEDFMSGGKISLQIYFLDNYQRKINFSKNLLRYNQYPVSIQKELMGLQVNIESISSLNTQLIGDKLINYLLYDEMTSSFILTDLTISASIDSQFYFTVSTSLQNIYQNLYPYLMEIKFRSCKYGETIQSLTSNINICQYCSLGTYSFEKPQQIQLFNSNQTSNNNSSQYISNQCKQCPSQALFCEGDQIKLKNGYWRPNQTTDEIIQCDEILNFCQPEETDSIEGCAEGYVGALCSECDLEGKVWNTTGTMYAPSILKGVCSSCSSIIFSYSFLGFNILCLLLYFFISEYTFFEDCQYSLTCFYLRKLNILPILKNSIKDVSGFYVKIMVTYFQFSQALIQQLNPFSMRILFPIAYMGSSNYYLTVGLSCILGKQIYQTYGKILVQTFIHTLTPIFFGFLVVFLLFLKRISSYQQPRQSSICKQEQSPGISSICQQEQSPYYKKSIFQNSVLSIFTPNLNYQKQNLNEKAKLNETQNLLVLSQNTKDASPLYKTDTINESNQKLNTINNNNNNSISIHNQLLKMNKKSIKENIK